ISSDNSIIISEIDGFNLKGENAAIGVSLEMKNDKGEDILNVADLAADMPEGMPWAEVKELLVVDFTIGADNPTSYVDIAVKIWDKNGEGSMTITSKVNVTQ